MAYYPKRGIISFSSMTIPCSVSFGLQKIDCMLQRNGINELIVILKNIKSLKIKEFIIILSMANKAIINRLVR